MNNILKTALIVVVVLAIAGGLFFAGSLFGTFAFRRMGFDMGRNDNMPMPRNFPGNQVNPNDQGQGNPPNGQNDGRGPGQRQGGGRMNPGQDRSPGLQGGMGGPNWNQPILTPVTSEEATKAAQDYIASLNIDGLEVGEVLIVNPQAYVTVKETATGNGAFELIVDPLDKAAHPLMGPATMWNLKYGGVLQTGKMGRQGRNGPKGPVVTVTPSADATATPAATPADVSADDMPLTEADAIKAAQIFLDTNNAGTTAATTVLKFYGYYSIDFSKDGTVIGKLSVNGYNGQVVGHAWKMERRP